MGEASNWPPEAALHRVHDRYLVEVVEQLGICPFARRSRELGRVKRPLFRLDAELDPARCCETLEDIVREHGDVEIVLLTFVLASAHPWHDARVFEQFLKSLREEQDRRGPPEFFMVCFHPAIADTLEPGRDLTKDSFVMLLRRSPDPVIQCVRISVLDQVRAQARKAARARFEQELQSYDPATRAMLKNAVLADPELSADIARNNFAALAQGEGRQELEGRLHSIMLERWRL